jgi:hypothetical protein
MSYLNYIFNSDESKEYFFKNVYLTLSCLGINKDNLHFSVLQNEEEIKQVVNHVVELSIQDDVIKICKEIYENVSSGNESNVFLEIQGFAYPDGNIPKFDKELFTPTGFRYIAWLLKNFSTSLNIEPITLNVINELNEAAAIEQYENIQKVPVGFLVSVANFELHKIDNFLVIILFNNKLYSFSLYVIDIKVVMDPFLFKKETLEQDRSMFSFEVIKLFRVSKHNLKVLNFFLKDSTGNIPPFILNESKYKYEKAPSNLKPHFYNKHDMTDREDYYLAAMYEAIFGDKLSCSFYNPNSKTVSYDTESEDRLKAFYNIFCTGTGNDLKDFLDSETEYSFSDIEICQSCPTSAGIETIEELQIGLFAKPEVMEDVISELNSETRKEGGKIKGGTQSQVALSCQFNNSEKLRSLDSKGIRIIYDGHLELIKEDYDQIIRTLKAKNVKAFQVSLKKEGFDLDWVTNKQNQTLLIAGNIKDIKKKYRQDGLKFIQQQVEATLNLIRRSTLSQLDKRELWKKSHFSPYHQFQATIELMTISRKPSKSVFDFKNTTTFFNGIRTNLPPKLIAKIKDSLFKKSALDTLSINQKANLQKELDEYLNNLVTGPNLIELKKIYSEMYLSRSYDLSDWETDAVEAFKDDCIENIINPPGRGWKLVEDIKTLINLREIIPTLFNGCDDTRKDFFSTNPPKTPIPKQNQFIEINRELYNSVIDGNGNEKAEQDRPKYFVLQRHGFNTQPSHVGLIIVLEDGTNFTLGLGYGSRLNTYYYNECVNPDVTTYWEAADFFHLCPASIYSPDQLIDPLNTIKDIFITDGEEPNNYTVLDRGHFSKRMINNIEEFMNYIVTVERIQSDWKEPGVMWGLDMPYRYSTMPRRGLSGVPDFLLGGASYFTKTNSTEYNDVQKLYNCYQIKVDSHGARPLQEINCADFANRIVGKDLAQLKLGPIVLAASYIPLDKDKQNRIITGMLEELESPVKPEELAKEKSGIRISTCPTIMESMFTWLRPLLYRRTIGGFVKKSRNNKKNRKPNNKKTKKYII